MTASRRNLKLLRLIQTNAANFPIVPSLPHLPLLSILLHSHISIILMPEKSFDVVPVVDHKECYSYDWERKNNHYLCSDCLHLLKYDIFIGFNSSL